MRGKYTLLLTGIIIFLMAIFKYHSPQLIEIESFCDPYKQICVHCPIMKSSKVLKRFDDIESIIRRNSSFRVLFCDKEFMFAEKSCASYMELVDSNLEFEEGSQILSNQFQNKVFYEMSQKFILSFTQNYYFLEHNEDFIVFTKQNESQKPKIYKQSDKNAEALFFFAKITNQSALIALVISTIMTFIGFSCFSFQNNRIPFLQILILSASFILSKNQLFFEHLHQTKAIFLLIISTKMINKYRYFKIISIAWLLACFLQSKCLIIGYYYLFHQFRKTKQTQFKLIISIIFVVFISLQALSIIPLSFLTYICILWQAIFLPILLLTFQDESTLGTNDSFQ